MYSKFSVEIIRNLELSWNEYEKVTKALPYDTVLIR